MKLYDPSYNGDQNRYSVMFCQNTGSINAAMFQPVDLGVATHILFQSSDILHNLLFASHCVRMTS